MSNLQYIRDHQGNTTGVFIHIEEWRELKKKYHDLQKEESASQVAPSWQQEIVMDRLEQLAAEPLKDFDQLLKSKRPISETLTSPD